MKRCPICGTTYPDRVDFCFSDGAPLVTVAEVVQRAVEPAADPKATAGCRSMVCDVIFGDSR